MSTTITHTITHHRPLPPRHLPQTTPITINGRFVQRVPVAPPPFTLSDIRRAIPAYCFKKNLITSFGYLVYDLTIIISLMYIATHITSVASEQTFGSTLAPLLQHVLWVCYWVCQGSVMTGLWVIGHECGHGGFANTQKMNDVVGWIVHSALLVPYFSWQISHRKHHGNTASIERDEVFVPVMGTSPQSQHHDDEVALIRQLSSSLYRSFRIVTMLIFGWPLYLFTNVTGNNSYPKSSFVNHFLPSSPIFEDIHKGQTLVLLSDLGVLLGVSVLAALSYFLSFTCIVYYYLTPYLITNLFLVLITLLQHTDQALPHYSADQWDWLRGALATVDRDYGILSSVFHHITDTHVVHHLFSSMPHYHAQEATEAIKGLLGPYYVLDETPIAIALWNSYGECNAVTPDHRLPGVYWY